MLELANQSKNIHMFSQGYEKDMNKQPKGLHKGLIQYQSKIAPKQNEMMEKSTLIRCSGERQKVSYESTRLMCGAYNPHS